MNWSKAYLPHLAAFAGASLLAVALGAVVCAFSGVSATLWGRNLVAWLVSGLAALVLARRAGVRTMRAVAILTPLAVAAPMLNEGQQGVHRWLDLGPLYVNAAMIALPAFVVALTKLLRDGGPWWIMSALLTQSLLVLQPDASQATALAVALCVAMLTLEAQPRGLRLGVALIALTLAAYSRTRPDPLAPVAEVEGVVRLAAELSPLLAALAVASLVAYAVIPILAARRFPGESVFAAGSALSALLLVWSAAPAFGAFPVPLVGMGMSPILGAWLGVGLLLAVARPMPT